MKRSTNRKRHRPEEVVAKLRQADEALAKGTPIAEVARSLGVSEMTLHRWRAEYGAVDRDAVRRRCTTASSATRPTRSACRRSRS
jgi:transposase-like protein